MEDDKRSIGTGAKRQALVRLGGRLRRARVRSGLTQIDVAHELGTTAQTVRNWETGKHEPPPATVKKLAERYRVNEKRLVEGLDSAIVPSRPIPGRGFRYDRVVVDPDKLTEARNNAGLTQSRIAELTGLSLSTIRRYESRSANLLPPTTLAPRTLETLATIYDKPAEWFTARGYFTDDERNRFMESVTPAASKEPHDDIVMETYHKAKPDLSDELKLRIANFIRFTHELELSGRGDDFLPLTALRNRRTARP